MKNLWCTVVILASVVGLGCSRTARSEPDQNVSRGASPDKARRPFASQHAGDELGGEVVIETIRNAETVEVFQLEYREYAEELSAYKVVEGPLPVEASLARELKEVVTAYDSYEREFVVGCNPHYHVRTRFVRGDSAVDVIYCLHCGILEVFHNGKAVGGGLFSPVKKQLISIAKRMLPDDEALQQLE